MSQLFTDTSHILINHPVARADKIVLPSKTENKCSCMHSVKHRHMWPTHCAESAAPTEHGLSGEWSCDLQAIHSTAGCISSPVLSLNDSHFMLASFHLTPVLSPVLITFLVHTCLCSCGPGHVYSCLCVCRDMHTLVTGSTRMHNILQLTFLSKFCHRNFMTFILWWWLFAASHCKEGMGTEVWLTWMRLLIKPYVLCSIKQYGCS